MDEAPTPAVVFDELFSDEGLLAKRFSRYENRPDQQEMAREIWGAFEGNHSALFEAGTGIGKSLAYLIPAILWSYRTGEKVVISTYTISLQEQLLKKDLPLLLDILGIDLRTVLVKGMGNYVCLRKLEEEKKREEKGISPICGWAETTSDGTRSSLSFPITGSLWSKVCAEGEVCSYMKCPHYKECFFFRDRGKVQDADLIIVNHHLLMSHLTADEGQALLPEFSRLVIDEAHHFPSVARSCLARVFDRVQLFKAMARIHSDNHPEVSRFFFLRDLLEKVGSRSLINRLGLDLPGEKRTLTTKINEAFDLLHEVFPSSSRETRWRLTPEVMRGKVWQEDLIPIFRELQTELTRYATSLESLVEEVKDLRSEETKSGIDSALLDIAAGGQKIKEAAGLIDSFFSDIDGDEVLWAEKKEMGTMLTLAQLDVAPFLKEKLFAPLKTAVCCSATMSVDEDFTHIASQFGIDKEECVLKIYPSPFDFQNRVRLLTPSDIPLPNSYDFVDKATMVIKEAIALSRGGAFVLFTSYDMLGRCAEGIESTCLSEGFPFFKQGDRPRHLMLEEFKQQKNSVLLGADSFWEGVDVVGEALRLVVIVKLPFPVPSDPLLQARSEVLKKEGKNPFMEDAVPQAALKFKQGFGRLMRSSTDRGTILCLDKRLFMKPYGKTFLRSLPECVTHFGPTEEVFRENHWSVAGSNR